VSNVFDALGAAREKPRPLNPPECWPWADPAVRCTACGASGLRIRSSRLDRRSASARGVVVQVLRCDCGYEFDHPVGIRP